jgi:hypothetical protein
VFLLSALQQMVLIAAGCIERNEMERIEFVDTRGKLAVLVGPCHHGMARPQVADRGTASDKEGSCE